MEPAGLHSLDGYSQGMGVEKLMAKADAIMKEIGHYAYQLPIEQRLVGTEDEIQAVCDNRDL
jgi:hypothetical protein